MLSLLPKLHQFCATLQVLNFFISGCAEVRKHRSEQPRHRRLCNSSDISIRTSVRILRRPMAGKHSHGSTHEGTQLARSLISVRSHLSAPHIGCLQVHCSVLCKGPSAVALNSSYGNRDCSRFKADLCAVVRTVAEATRGGVLVFFPSHASMKGITDEWRRYGGYRDLEAVKSVFAEPRTAQEFQQV
jgi:hypothetical protein